MSWGHTRNYSNRLSGLPNTNGDRWVVRQCARLKQTGTTIRVILGPRRVYTFDNVGTAQAPVYEARYGARQTLKKDAGGFQFVRTNGAVWRFHDFDQTQNPQGSLHSVTPGTGQSPLTYHYDASDRLDEVKRSQGETPETVTEETVKYEYNLNNQLEKITLTRKVGDSSPINLRRAVYTYDADKLEQVDLQQYTSDWDTTGSYYYRYHSTGRQLLKLVLGPAAYERAQQDLVDVTSVLDSALQPYADYYFEYDDNDFVKREDVKNGTKRYDFTYEFQPVTDDYNKWTTKSVETLPDGSINTVYANFLGQMLLKEHAVGTQKWVEHRVIHDLLARVKERWTPAAVQSYTVLGNTLNVTATSSGLIHITEYGIETDATDAMAGDVKGRVKSRKLRKGSSATVVTLSATKYIEREDSSGTKTYPVTEHTVYQQEGSGSPTTTKYNYDWHLGTSQIKRRETVLPAVSAQQHGEGVAHSIFEVFDDYGREIWQKGGRGFIRYKAYDNATGHLLQSIEDVDSGTLTPPYGWTTPSGWGKHLVTDYEYDDLGRQTEMLGPKHEAIDASGNEIELRRASWTFYKDHLETWTAQGYRKASDNAPTLINPVSISMRTQDGLIVDSIAAKYDDAAALPDPTTYDFDDQTKWLRWSSQHFNALGQLTSSRVYHTIPDVPALDRGHVRRNFDQTDYGYDDLGRQDRMVSPGGTITRTVFDGRGRVVSTWVGTDDNEGAWTPTNTAGTNLIEVSALQYDNGGIGNGLVTQQTQVVDANSANDRVTELQYDWRNRPTKTFLPPDAQNRTIYNLQVYDNVDRVVRSQTYLEQVAGSGSGSGSGSGLSDVLLDRSDTKYDDRGRAYQAIRYEVSNGVVGNKLIDRMWYDCCGNVIKQQPGGGQLFTKTEYDSQGRAEKTYTGLDTSESTYGEAETLVGDTIYEQTSMLYDAAGNVTANSSLSRYHNGAGTGALVADINARPNYSASWHDSLGRAVTAAEYGNQGNDNTAFDRSTLAMPTSSSATVLVTKNGYNDAGEGDVTFDPAGRKHVSQYDDAGRVIRTIQNYTGTGDPRTGSDDQNIAVDTTYTPDGQVATLTALQKSSANDQVTTYVYGTDKGGIAPLIYRNDLLRAEIYPDSDDVASPLGNGGSGSGSTSGSGYDRVEYQYNRQGQIIARKDQNETVHAYQYDKLGRQLADEVTYFGTGIDNSVKRIATVYDKQGQVSTITSYDDQAIIVNQIKRTYNDLGQLTSEKQSTAGIVTGRTPTVYYEYDHTSSDGEFTLGLRPTSMTYPDGRKLHYVYSGTDELLNRVTSVREDNGSGSAGIILVSYEYLGLGLPVSTHLEQPDVKLEYDFYGNNSYGAMDALGRVIDHRWQKIAGSSGSGSGSGSVSLTNLVHLKHGYDTASNRLWREDVVAASNGQDLDELYGYDQANRLVDFQRGALNASHDAISSPSIGHDWGLDSLGNWETFSQTETNPFSQTRTHNKANEIKTISNGDNPVHDRAGNMTEIPQPADLSEHYDATWDAWNRLVVLKDATVKVAEYQYDGLNRRTLKESYTSVGILDETRHFYYSEQWQVLEERVDSSSNAERQFVWGLRYVDDLVLRDRDSTANGIPVERLYALQDVLFNVVAIVNGNAEIDGRFAYQPYGQCIELNPDFKPYSGVDYEWSYRFTGRRLDNETLLYIFRSRYYSAALGRFLVRDYIGYEGGANLYTYVGSSPISHLDPLGEDLEDDVPANPGCEKYVANRTLGGPSKRFDRIDVAAQVELFLSAERCCKACSDGSLGYTVEGTIAGNAGFELGIASFGGSGTLRFSSFVGRYDYWFGVRLFGGARGTIKGSAKWDTCDNSFSLSADAFVAGTFGVEGGGSANVKARLTRSIFGWRPSVNVGVRAIVKGRLTAKYWPKISCDFQTCVVEGPFQYSGDLYGEFSVKLWKWRIGKRWDIGGFEGQKFHYRAGEFDNPFV